MGSARRLLAGGLVAVLCGALAGTATAAFPGVNGKIALSRDGQIVVKNPGDLTGGTALTATGDNQDPAWSPDGLRIAFVSDRAGGTYNVWTMNADGSNQAQLTFESGDAEAPAWSPDGTRMAYGVSNGTDDDVVVRGLTNGSRLVVAGGPGDQDLPVFTADGSRVIFNDDSVGGLSVVGATGAGRASFLSDAEAPDVSPDGTRIVVRRTDIQRLQVVNADGTGGTPVLDGEPAAKPVWSPDGTRIVFQKTGMGSQLFSIPSTGAASSSPETTAGTLNFNADWQAIGAVPVITGLPQALVAGAPGATLTVDGRGFAFRSVVRWNGADRPTTWVSPTRLTAQLTAADVASPGTAQVTVFTSPSGGGLSAPATATVPAPPPPPPRILVKAAGFSKATWRRSRVRGTLRVAGTLERAGRVEVALLRGKRVAQRTVLKLPAGAFTKKVALSRSLLPGRYTLRLREIGTPSGPALVTTQRGVRLTAPPEGVVSRTFVAALLNGPPARTLRDKSRIFAHFVFAALPKGKRRITTTWFPPGPPTGTDVRPRTRLVTSFLTRKPELPAGTYRCELRVDGALVAVASIRLR